MSLEEDKRINDKTDEKLKQLEDQKSSDGLLPEALPEGAQLVADNVFSDARHEIVNLARLRGNATIKRMPEQRERDLIEIARAALRGLTTTEIAAQLNARRPYSVSPETIYNDLEAVKERWQHIYATEIETAKVRELAHIEELERAYWEAWARSLRDREETKSLLIEDKSGSVKGTTTPLYERKKIEHKKTERDGSSQFLAGVQWCIEARCKILGLNAPQKYEIDWRAEAKKAGIEPGDIFNEIVGEYLKAPESTVGRNHAKGSMDGSPTDSED